MKLKDIWGLFKKSFLQWQDDKAELLAAAISYYAIFSIVPLFILGTIAAGFFVEVKAIEHELFHQIETIYSGRAALAVESLLDVTQKSGTGTASLVSIVLLIFLSSKVFTQLQKALDVIWRTKPKRITIGNFLLKKIFSFMMLTGVGAFIFIFFIIDAAFQVFKATFLNYFPAFQNGLLFGSISHVISVILFSLLFAFAYRFLPHSKVKWSDVWLGAIVTALLFGVGRYLFTLYFGLINLSSVYGAAGSIIIILMWFYFSATIFLYGAKFTYVYTKEFGSLRFNK